MDAWREFLLGILQGLTEFLPISSSGHLSLAEEMLGLNQDSLTFAIFVHGATLLSLITVFFKPVLKNKGTTQDVKNLFLKIIIGSLPAITIGLFLKSQITGIYGNFTIGAGFTLTGCLFLLTLLFKPKTEKQLNSLGFSSALIIGCFQALAILPGFSRSGWTIAVALLLGFSPRTSYFFSFLLAFPVLLGAFILSALESTFSFSIGWIGAFLGAYVAGVLSLYLLLFVLKKGKLYFFSFYLIPLGLYLLLF